MWARARKDHNLEKVYRKESDLADKEEK